MKEAFNDAYLELGGMGERVIGNNKIYDLLLVNNSLKWLTIFIIYDTFEKITYHIHR